MKNMFLLFYLLVFLASSCTTPSQKLESQFEFVLDSLQNANPETVGMMIHVEAPDRNISWSGAAGHSSKDSKLANSSKLPVLLASITKTYVSASILRLVEQKKISIDMSISSLLSKKTSGLLGSNNYQIDSITVKHLLSHTSGIADYVDENYLAFIDANKGYVWKRGDQIALAMEVGQVLAKPGEAYQYADVNYLLLTEIIEQQTRKPFYLAMRELLKFKELGLDNTWFYGLEKHEMDETLAHQYFSKHDWDSGDINPSWDLYGGGGVAATVSDAARFFQLLFEGQIIQNKETLALMSTSIELAEPTNYCLGLRNIQFKDMEAYYHGGFWGTDVMYIPQINATISAFTLEKTKRELNAKLSTEVLKILER